MMKPKHRHVEWYCHLPLQVTLLCNNGEVYLQESKSLHLWDELKNSDLHFYWQILRASMLFKGG